MTRLSLSLGKNWRRLLRGSQSFRQPQLDRVRSRLFYCTDWKGKLLSEEWRMHWSHIKGGLGFVLPLLLAACTAPPGDQAVSRDTSASPPLPPADAASLSITNIETGFLFFGTTQVSIVSIDGRQPATQPPMRIAPGHHAMMIKAFRDPVASFACMQVDLEKAHAYSIHTTPPDMDTTTIWLEDATTGQIVGEKIKANNTKDPLMWGPGLKLLLLTPPDLSCPPVTPAAH